MHALELPSEIQDILLEAGSCHVLGIRKRLAQRCEVSLVSLAGPSLWQKSDILEGARETRWCEDKPRQLSMRGSSLPDGMPAQFDA